MSCDIDGTGSGPQESLIFPSLAHEGIGDHPPPNPDLQRLSAPLHPLQLGPIWRESFSPENRFVLTLRRRSILDLDR
jgi:hypothetical protein